jgi:Cyclophilin-like family
MKIRIRINGSEIAATLLDSATSRDFVSLLPLQLKLEDYGETEKISYLPRKLSTKDAPPGSNPSVGDVSYYAPWGNLAIFRRDFRSRRAHKIGKSRLWPGSTEPSRIHRSNDRCHQMKMLPNPTLKMAMRAARVSAPHRDKVR